MMVAEGNVTVDGQVELRKRCKIRPGQVVEYEAADHRHRRPAHKQGYQKRHPPLMPLFSQ
ncbi:MAG: RNA-binding S4 domain-containing protein [Syntrophotaleaceae bacterium]